MDKIKLQKLISQYKTAHPNLHNKTDMQIISIMCKDPNVKKEDIAQLSTLLASNNQTIGDNFKISNKVKTRTGGDAAHPLIVKTTKGKAYNINQALNNRINNISKNLKKAEDSNGVIGSAWSGFKNLTGIGDSSDDVRRLIETEKGLLKEFNSNPKKRSEIFKNLTGIDYSPNNLLKFAKGEIKLKSEVALLKYTEGQEMALDITTDIISGVVSYGTAAACIAGGIAAAPFTAGASLGAVAVGVGIAAGAGAATKVLLKAGDAVSGGRKYTFKDLGKDAAIGGVSGALAPLTIGLGGVVANTVGKTAPKIIAQTARFSAEGGLFGAADSGTRAALEGESIVDVALATIEGGVVGTLAGNAMGHGGQAISKGINKGLMKLHGIEFPWVTKQIENLTNYLDRSLKLNQNDKDAFKYLFNGVRKQNIKTEIKDYDWKNIIKVIKNSGEYTQEDCDAVLSLLSKTNENKSILKLFANVSHPNEFQQYLNPKEVMELAKALKDLNPDQIKAILGEGKSLGNLIWFNDSYSFNDSLLNFTKIIPEAKNMSIETLQNLKKICNYSGPGGLDGLTNQEKNQLLKLLKKLTPKEIEIFEKNGININKLTHDINPVTSGFDVKVDKNIQNQFLKSVIANNNPAVENTLRSSEFKNYLSGLEQSGNSIPLKYSREAFIKDLQELLNKLPTSEREKVLKHLNININNGDFNGFIKLNDFNYNEFLNESKSTLKSIKSIVDNFVTKNETKIPDSNAKKVLDDLIKGFPEFTSIIGKIDADHTNTLEVHILQTLSEALSHPEYANLNHFEKTMLKFSILMHDIGKIGGKKTAHWEDSARYARSILDKFNLSQDMKEGIVNLIRYHHFGENPSEFYNYFRTPSQQKIARIIGNSDYAARFKTNNKINPQGSALRGLNDYLYTTKNSTMNRKYPTRTFTLQNGQKVSVTVADLRKVNYSETASKYGWYNNKTLGETYVQVHNCKSAADVENVIQGYLNPNKDIALSTTITSLKQTSANGYGRITLILSTGKGNNVVRSLDGAGSGSGGKKGFKSFVAEAYNEPARIWNDTWTVHPINEVIALNPKIESIALKNTALENIPTDLIELAAKYNIPITLLP